MLAPFALQLHQFFTNLSSISTQTTYIPRHNPHQKRPSDLQLHCKLSLRAPRCWVSFFFLCGRQVPPTPTFGLKHIGRLVRMSVSGYRGRRFEPRHLYVVSLSKTLFPHCFSRLSCEMSTRWGQPRDGYSVQ